MAGPIDRFDDSAKRVLALAQSEALRFHHRYVGPEHLLLGLLSEPTGAAQILSSFGVDGRRVYQALAQMGTASGPQDAVTEVVLSPETKKVIALATEEADQLGAARVAPEHLLLGILREPGQAGPILRELGVSLESIREKVTQSRRGD